MRIEDYAAETFVHPTMKQYDPQPSTEWSTGKKILAVGASVAAATALAAILIDSDQIPKKAKAITPFDVEKYLGKWYEIARMDYKYENGLSHVTAEYSWRSDGKIKVFNKGYNELTDEWQEAEGKAKFANDPEVAELRVSFFGPFYEGYNVIGLDPDYKYALVAGESLKYLWILSRTPEIPQEVKDHFLAKAKKIGYQVEKLVWTIQD